MKRTIASILVLILTILYIGGGYSETDVLNGGAEVKEIVLEDQLPEHEQESEDNMAAGDKLVNLDDLKVAYDERKSSRKILIGDFTKIGGNHFSSTMYPLVDSNFSPVAIGGLDFSLEEFDGYVWIRTPLFKIYDGQTLTANIPGIHFWKCTDNDMATAYSHKAMSENTPVTIESDEYGFLCAVVNAENMPETDTVTCEVSGISKYADQILFEDEPLVSNYNVGEYKSYRSNGIYAYGNNNVVRGAAYPYEGNILYTNQPSQGHAYPFAIATNGTDIKNAAFLQVSLVRGQNKGTLNLCWGSNSHGFSFDEITFTNAFQGNLNGASIEIKNNVLTVTYIYEGSIVTNSAPVSEYYQYLYDRMDHVTGCSTQTGTSPNIAYYGRGFASYEDYYRFIKTLNDDSQIADHEARIETLEEGGGGGGGGGDLDWAKGYDLLTFGQEYLYAWLYALNNGNSFKVLFTGDSTTAYYDGTVNGLKEIFKSCMEEAGYTNGTYVNRGVSGINASTWLNQYLSGDIAQAPTLYVIRHGFNNEAGETEEEMAEAFRTTMIEALTQIRASLSVTQCSIILMTPNTSDDDENHRGISMKKKLDPIVRQLARSFGCGFIDTFRTWYDPGVYADPMYDDPFGDHRSIHPNGLMNRLIISKLFDFVCPAAYRLNGGN